MADENTGVVANLVQIVVPQPCFDEFFVKFNFFDVDCLKVVISKCLGLAIIAGSLMVKVPQIMKIVQAQSGKGINMLSSTLEIAAITATLVYSFAQGFPFSAYGEAVFMLIQTVLVAFLVLCYTDRRTTAVLYVSVYMGILTMLMSPLMPRKYLWYLQASVLPNVVIARMIQAVTNYSNQSTGQLSIVTFALLFLGSIARIFTSLQETGDATVVTIYMTSSFCNFIILSQILYYGSGKKEKKA